MALFKISHGDSAQLENQSKVAGYCWFTTDDGKFYIDWTDDPEEKTNIIRTAINAAHADTATSADEAAHADSATSVSSNEATEKIYLIGTESQSDSAQTYSTSETYIGKDKWLHTPSVIATNSFELQSYNDEHPDNSGVLSLYASPSNSPGRGNSFILDLKNTKATYQQLSLRLFSPGYQTYTYKTADFIVDPDDGEMHVVAKNFDGTYFNGYALGNACEKFYIDNAAATAITKSTDLITEQAVYYGLPFINNKHNYNSGTRIWAPTDGGYEGYVLISSGPDDAPIWTSKQEFLGDLTLTPDKLDSSVSVGDDWTPIYFSDGSPILCGGQFLFYEELSNVINFTSPDTMYLSIAGGELTGDLIGTTATFNSVTATTITGDQVFGAVWNDYAEYRMTTAKDNEPGRVVREHGNDLMVKTTERLMAGCKVVSDTYGFAIGETGVARTPIAVSGRVLAYPYEDRSEYSVGDAVCSGPNGTISKMTREEIINYPDRIIGTVSSIPEYSVWGPKEIPVNGRIWIYVR